MKPLKKSTGILATAILIVMISGLLLANQMIDYLENNITTDYTKVYHDDLNRFNVSSSMWTRQSRMSDTR